METDYGYDALNNLWNVTQRGNGTSGARVRSFTYDSLSRLLCSSNPEAAFASCPSAATSGYTTGTIGYTYDANGNVQTKTDARGITTQYGYDFLNRLLSKTYSDNTTPSSCFQYDTTAPNGVGHLANAWTQSSSAGSCPSAPPAAFWTKRSIISYDAMGRVLNERQFVPGGSTNGTITPPSGICSNRGAETGISYCYDLAGDLTFSTNGMNSSAYLGGQSPIGLTYTYDVAGRLGMVTSNYTNSNVYPANLFSPPTGQEQLPCAGTPSAAAQYWPFGGLMNAVLGNGITLNRTYDNRLRTSCENDTGSR
jgi:YD repeat-containing protein